MHSSEPHVTFIETVFQSLSFILIYQSHCLRLLLSPNSFFWSRASVRSGPGCTYSILCKTRALSSFSHSQVICRFWAHLMESGQLSRQPRGPVWFGKSGLLIAKWGQDLTPSHIYLNFHLSQSLNPYFPDLRVHTSSHLLLWGRQNYKSGFVINCEITFLSVLPTREFFIACNVGTLFKSVFGVWAFHDYASAGSV